MTKNQVIIYLLFTLLFLLAITSQPAISQLATPETLFVTVYSDGFVFIDYTVLLDPTSPTQNITVFGQVLEDLLVVNKDGLPIDYSLCDSLLSVYSLGAEEIEITYLTQDLTSKAGRFWTLTINVPLTTMIVLPEETTIISLNQVPETIETNNNRLELQMSASLIEVTYVIGVVGTKEHAQLVLDDAETSINQVISLGINVTEAETKLTEAMEAFHLGNYVEAETIGNEAKNLAIQINQTATQAQLQIDEAEDAIAYAQNEGRTIGLNEAQDFFNQAKSAYDIGNYLQALNSATQAKTKALEAKNPEEAGPPLFYGIFGIVLISTIVVFGLVIIRLRREPKNQEIGKKKRLIDIKRIFREHMDLMPEEKQAVQFLADNNGEAFEAELYDYVKLPRTTTWRLVKRLERMGIIRTSKFRRQNLIRVKSKYDIKE